MERTVAADYANIAGMVVLKDGERVYENYFGGCTENSRIHVFLGDEKASFLSCSGHAAAAFSAVYAAIILVVYFTQLTTVRLAGLTEKARELLDFQQMGLFFSLDLLGYALMSLATFFAGLTVEPKDKPSK